jgi:integrase/recombinase XerD
MPSISNKYTTVQHLFNCFIKECDTFGRTPSTIKNYSLGYNIFVQHQPGIGRQQITAINNQTIVNYTAYLRERNTSTATINSYIRSIRAFMYWCMNNHYIPAFKIRLVKEREQLKEPYTHNELSVLLRKPNARDSFPQWRAWAVINWVIALGSRVSTIANVTMSDIDIRNSTVVTRHNKNGRVDSVAMPSELKKALLEYMRHRPDSEYLFCNVDGGKINSAGLAQAVGKYNKSRGVSKTSVHLLRHTFGALWAENGGDVFGLQKVLGHSDIRMTQKYVNIYGNDNTNSLFIKYNPLENLK